MSGVQRRVWRWGARNYLLLRALNTIACGRPLDCLDDALGKLLVSGAIRDDGSGRLYRVYRNAYVIVTVTTLGPDKSVDAFSVTVRESKLHFGTGQLAAGHLDVNLGHTRFGAVADDLSGARLRIGANRFGYTEAF